MPLRSLNRSLSRSLNRSTTRRLTRFCTRLAPGARRPDYLGDLLSHLRASIRHWRRLLRLAPEIFDYNIAKRADVQFAKTAARHREAPQPAVLPCLVHPLQSFVGWTFEVERSMFKFTLTPVPMPLRSLNRSLSRSLNRSTTRRLTRFCTRLAPGARRPDYLGDLLSHLRASIRHWRRLLRLAPEIFDYNVAQRADVQFARAAARHREALTALAKVYGDPPPDFSLPSPSQDPFWCKEGEEKVKRIINIVTTLSPQTRGTIDHLLAEIVASQAAISKTLATCQRLRPHDVPSLSRMADIIDAAFTLRRLVCCLDTIRPTSDELAAIPADQFERDLARTYPPPPKPSPADTVPLTERPTAPIPQLPSPSPCNLPLQVQNKALPSAPPPSASDPPIPHRVPDAYSRGFRIMKALRFNAGSFGNVIT